MADMLLKENKLKKMEHSLKKIDKNHFLIFATRAIFPSD